MGETIMFRNIVSIIKRGIFVTEKKRVSRDM